MPITKATLETTHTSLENWFPCDFLVTVERVSWLRDVLAPCVFEVLSGGKETMMLYKKISAIMIYEVIYDFYVYK